MKVLSIIVSSPECPVISIDSFGIVDEQLSNEVVDKAEGFFIEKCVELKYGTEEMRNECVESGCFSLDDFDNYRDDLSEALDDGYEEVAMHTISIAWSDIENVQL